jgi:hypothetical protein
MVKK